MERRYVGIDLHRRRSVIVTMDEAGSVLNSVRIPHDPVAMFIGPRQVRGRRWPSRPPMAGIGWRTSSSPQKLASWTGLTPKHRESDLTRYQLDISKQGSKLVRWAAIEAVAGPRGGTKLTADYERIADRRGKYRARVAVARKLLTLVYYGLRDGEIRCLQRAT